MFCRRAQSLVEYLVLFAIVAAAITFSYKLVYKLTNARVKQVQNEMTYRGRS